MLLSQPAIPYRTARLPVALLLLWWSTYLVAPEVGLAFLGSQGDPWDTQWDMFLALIGAIVGLLFFGRRHDRSMEKLTER